MRKILTGFATLLLLGVSLTNAQDIKTKCYALALSSGD